MKHIRSAVYTALFVSIAALAGAVAVTDILPVAASAAAQEVPAESLPEVQASSAKHLQAEETLATPDRLIIPDARVNAHITDVGVTPTNNLDVPPNYTDVGWYRYGPRPGEEGSAVLDGHVDNGAAIDGVFKHLRDLRIGDDISVITDAGDTLHFTVIATDVYETAHFPSEDVFHGGSGKLLKIITCHGIFVPSEGTYDHRLIVTARLAPEK